MAIRPIFNVSAHENSFVEVNLVDFKWFAGMSVSQKQKSIQSLHSEVDLPFAEILEISSKSPETLGVDLSAFNLCFSHPKHNEPISVESAFQGSKVFPNSGPFHEIYGMTAREAKGFFKEKNLGSLSEFNFFGQNWSTRPYTLFYDWVYMQTLHRNSDLVSQILQRSCFTDIEFNPKRSINCQAYSAALYVALSQKGLLERVLASKEDYINLLGGNSDWVIEAGYGKFHPDKPLL